MSEQDIQAAAATNDAQQAELETESEVESAEDGSETVESLKEALEREKTAKTQILARAKKAESELKTFKTAPRQDQAAQNTNSNVPSDEQIESKILQSQGMDMEMLNELKALAKVRGKGLIECQNDPIFVAIKEKRDSDAKAAKARLPASRGSGTVKKEKTVNTPGLTDAEHKELWRQATGR